MSDGNDTSTRLVEAVKAKIERHISFRRTRVTHIRVGSVVLSFRVERTEKGNRLYVTGPDGLEIEHISLTVPPGKA